MISMLVNKWVSILIWYYGTLFSLSAKLANIVGIIEQKWQINAIGIEI